MIQVAVASVNDQLYGIDISVIHDISHVPELTRLPGANDIEGIYNFRGTVISVYDMAKVLGQGHLTTSQNKIVVLETDNHKIGVLVSDVEQIIRLDEKDIKESPVQSDMIFGVAEYDGHLVILINFHNR